MWEDRDANLIHERGCVLRKTNESQLGRPLLRRVLRGHGHGQVSAKMIPLQAGRWGWVRSDPLAYTGGAHGNPQAPPYRHGLTATQPVILP